jgi:hypothetical protein
VTAVIRKNVRRGSATPPLRDDGALHAFAMFFDGDERIAYADAHEDLLAVLIDGYAAMDEQDRLAARIRLAVRAQVRIQAALNADVDPAVWNALDAEDREVLTGSRHEQPRIDFWDPEVPLVLVETGYAPFTDVDQPISGIADVRYPPNMIWLRPAEERDLLESLDRAGFIRLHQAVAP